MNFPPILIVAFSFIVLLIVYYVKKSIQLKYDTEKYKKVNYDKKVKDFNEYKENWEKQFEQDIIKSQELQKDVSAFELEKEKFEKYKSDFLKNKENLDLRINIATGVEKRIKKIYDGLHSNTQNLLGDSYQIARTDIAIIERLAKAFGEDYDILSLNNSATIQHNSKIYDVNLQRCSCKDFEIHKKPCKHMLFLANYLGFLKVAPEVLEDISFKFNEDYQNIIRKKAKLEQDIYALNCELETVQKAVAPWRRERTLENQIKKQEDEFLKLKEETNNLQHDMNELIDTNTRSFPQIAATISDLLTLHYNKSASLLEKKKHPAHTEAKRIKELRKETRQILTDKKLLEYKLAYIENLYPNIAEIFDEDNGENVLTNMQLDEDIDRVSLFISKEEYSSLSVTERNQKALDNYLKKDKSKWQIGRDYEMYIGYLYSAEGYVVEYNGIIKKLEDMGRDLIVKKADETLIIQCKHWSSEKTIHEKHLFQLYGTVILYNVNNACNAKGVFITSTTLSNTAKKVADYLGIQVLENKKLGDFPRIKCNINRGTREKIYHLPFDQQYDNTIIGDYDEEMYAFTVKEAEQNGFRRAFKHIVH